MAKYQQAHDISSLIEEVARRSSNELQLAVGLSGKGECLLRWGKWEEAHAAFEEAYELLKASDYKSERLRVTGLGALTCWRMSDLAGTQRYQQLAGEDLQDKPLKTVSMFEAFVSLATIALEKADADGGKQLQAACLQLKQYAKCFPIGWSRYYLTLGRMKAASGKTNAALKLWKRALHFAEQHSLPLEKGTALYLLGKHGPSERGTEQLQQAVAILCEIGAAHERQLAQAALG